MLQAGDGVQAEQFHRDALTIDERLAAADPGNAQAQRDLTISYNKLDDLMRQTGDSTETDRPSVPSQHHRQSERQQ
jgi:hypothetical protein